MYSTSQIAKRAGVHPNTVRFYEDMGLLPVIPRKENNYREYSEFHLEQLKLIRIAFSSEITSGNLRKMTIEIIKLSAEQDFTGALSLTGQYLDKVKEQKENAQEAIRIIERMADADPRDFDHGALVLALTRKEAALSLGITVEVLRNWERNGLIDTPRATNGYRVYGNCELNRLAIIRTLRNANYSMMSILRLLSQMEESESPDFQKIIDTPLPEEDILSVTDRFITSLEIAAENGREMLNQLLFMKQNFAPANTELRDRNW